MVQEDLRKSFAQDCLSDVFTKRTKKNPAYSLRSFAKSLNVSISWLSDFLNSKKGISRERAEHIAILLGLTPRKYQRFIQSAEAEFARNRVARVRAQRLLKSKFLQHPYIDVDQANWELIASWKNFAVMEILKLEHQPCSVESIQKLLGLSLFEAQSCLGVLQRCNIVSFSKGAWTLNVSNTQTQSVKDGHLAIRKFHEGMLLAAQQALVANRPDERCSYGIVFAASDDALPHIQKRTEEFLKSLDSELDDMNFAKNKVFGLAIHTFPLSISKDRGEPNCEK